MKLIKPILIALLFTTVLISCKKETSCTGTGTLKVTFASPHAGDLKVKIYSIENTNIPITDRLTLDAKGSVLYSLDTGNYILHCVSSSFYPNAGFQIKAGETTTIYYDSKHLAHVY